jgi:hypothetical protein
MASEAINMAASSNSDEQGHDEHASAAGFEFEVDFSTSPEAPAQDFMFGEQQLLTSSSTPEHDSSAPEGAARNLLIIPAPLGSRNTVFFLDNCRRLAVTHYQTELTFTAPAAVTTPQFSLQFYIRSNESMFNTRDNLMTILGWCEKLLLLPAIEHLLHELGLSGTSIRFEVYDGFDSFKVSPALCTCCDQAEKTDFVLGDHRSQQRRERASAYVHRVPRLPKGVDASQHECPTRQSSSPPCSASTCRRPPF